MNLGWLLFKHSVLMVWRNFQQALQIFLLPTILAIAIVLGAAFGLGVPPGAFATTPEGSGDPVPGGLYLFIWIAFMTIVFVMCWTVVAWHRFVLLEEYPQGWIPAVKGDRIAAYVGRSILLILAFFAMSIPLVIVMTATMGVPVVMWPLLFACSLIVYVFGLRLSITLPAAAIGSRLTFGQAFEETRGAFWPILTIAFCSGVLGFSLNAVELLFANIPVLYYIWAVPTQLFVAVLNVSVITTLFGHYVEKRTVT